jgi:hypothetical protein
LECQPGYEDYADKRILLKVFNDNYLHIVKNAELEPVDATLYVSISGSLKKCLQITKYYEYYGRQTFSHLSGDVPKTNLYDKVYFEMKKPYPPKDVSPMLFYWDTPGGLIIHTKEKLIIAIPHLLWTFDTLSESMSYLNNHKTEFDIQLHKDPYRLEITTTLENQRILLSESVAKSFGLTTMEYDLSVNEKLILNITPLHGMGPLIKYESSAYLWRNIYKDIRHLIQDLNDIFVRLVDDIVLQQQIFTSINSPKLTIDDKNLISFQIAYDYKLILEPTMLQILHLQDTETDQKGTVPVYLSLPTCEYFYVNTDLVTHFVNNEYSELLRVINNNAMNDQKSMQSFKKLQYYGLSKELIHDIRIYVTDRNGEVLPFSTETTFLLHFRPCRE